MKYSVYFLTLILLSFQSCSDEITGPVQDLRVSQPIAPYYPVGNNNQLNWQEAKMAMFFHFGVNTFTGNEWGNGYESPDIFNPTKLNVKQWIMTAAENGYKYAIITAKHHDGFCLWPSKFTEHTVKNSPYKNGSGDIVKEFADACRMYGIKFGFYLSPWDLHEETYGSEEYNYFYQNQLIELLTNYGEVSLVWLDGAKGPDVHQDYDLDLYFYTIRQYQPNALIAIMGPDIRWIGNENGIGSETEWCIQHMTLSIQPTDAYKRTWFPSECDVSIRPGWFYHEAEDDNVKSVDTLIDIYFKSVGRNSNLHLNVPPNKEGLISQHDISRLRDFSAALSSIFHNDLFQGKKITASDYMIAAESYYPENCLDNNNFTFWTPSKNVLTADLIIDLGEEKEINIIQLEEEIKYGQRISSFSIHYEKNNEWIKILDGTTIGRTRLLKFDKISSERIKITINEAFASPTLRCIKGFYYSGFD